ncbi:hypothetical protein HOH87_02875 [bacterium]|jgi:hypothetical protein|nr:hypothetical protein [bacterium]
MGYPSIPPHLIWELIALVGGLTGFIIYCLQKTSSRLALKGLGLIILWLGFTGLLATKGFFLAFDSLPPRFIVAMLPPTIFLVWCIKSDRITQYFTPLSPVYFVGIQSFRVMMELILMALSSILLLPLILTYHGWNYDILIGLSAPLISYRLFARQSVYRVARVWNKLGILQLLVIIGTALLSIPSPFQQLAFDTPTIFAAYFPFIWVPAFIVPCALFFHIVSLKQLSNK